MTMKLALAAIALTCLAAPLFAAAAPTAVSEVHSLYRLRDARTTTENALWGENPKVKQFGDGRSKVVVADLKGPGIITMIHFALPATLKLNRDCLLRIYWDGEKNPSVEAPLVDFFCDPNGALERVDSALVNKKRGWNCYFPMPFAKSARVVIETDNGRYPNGNWQTNPCYSYVTWHTVKALPKDAGYFHACWRQQTLLLGREDYKVFEADGKGQFIGWNVTVRGVGAPNAGYVVDQNVKFYVDGEAEPSTEWQGIEDAFGFSWGFPEQANSFPYTGYQPYYSNGAAAYRFTLNDRITFSKSLRMTVGFGKNENPIFREMFSKPENPLQFSSVAYWYQKEPHKPFPAIAPARDRTPAMLSGRVQKPREPSETLALACGSPDGDVEYLAEGWDFVFKEGYPFSGSPWTSEIKHCWADNNQVEFDIICPKGVSGTLKLYLLDGDNFAGGRKQTVTVAGRLIGEYEGFQTGQWVEVPISAADTANGRIPVALKNRKPKSNAVVTYVRFVQS